MHIRLRSLAALVVLALALAAPSVYAEEQKQPTSGITVAPASVILELEKGTSTQESAVGIRNNSPKAVRLSAAIRGLQQATDGSFAPSDVVESGMAKALSVDQPEFTIEPGKSLNLKLQLRDNTELTPGGHYASLFIREVQASGQNLSLSQAVSVRVFVIKETGAVRALSIAEVRDNGSVLKVPNIVTVAFMNTGNVAVVPRASVGVYDPRGRLVQSGVINTESVTVLPAKRAQLQEQLTPIGRAFIPGRYTVHIIYRYEGSEEQLNGTVSLFVVPPLFVAGLFLVLALMAAVGWLVWRFWPHRRGTFILKRPVATPKADHDGKKVPKTTGDPDIRRRKRRRIDI